MRNVFKGTVFAKGQGNFLDLHVAVSAFWAVRRA